MTFARLATTTRVLGSVGCRPPQPTKVLSMNDMPIIQVEPNGRVRSYPGTALEEQDFMKGRPEYHWVLAATKV